MYASKLYHRNYDYYILMLSDIIYALSEKNHGKNVMQIAKIQTNY